MKIIFQNLTKIKTGEKEGKKKKNRNQEKEKKE